MSAPWLGLFIAVRRGRRHRRRRGARRGAVAALVAPKLPLLLRRPGRSSCNGTNCIPRAALRRGDRPAAAPARRAMPMAALAEAFAFGCRPAGPEALDIAGCGPARAATTVLCPAVSCSAASRPSSVEPLLEVALKNVHSPQRSPSLFACSAWTGRRAAGTPFCFDRRARRSCSPPSTPAVRLGPAASRTARGLRGVCRAMLPVARAVVRPGNTALRRDDRSCRLCPQTIGLPPCCCVAKARCVAGLVLSLSNKASPRWAARRCSTYLATLEKGGAECSGRSHAPRSRGRRPSQQLNSLEIDTPSH